MVPEKKEVLHPQKLIIAFVGMPGAGKSEAASFLSQKGIPFIRFGEITDEGLREAGLPINPDNERFYRKKLREELGMAAYAIKSKPKIEEALRENRVVAIDGLYSWEEYVYLKGYFPELVLVHIFAEPPIRYERLSKRAIRPLSPSEARARDVSEIEDLNKGGPIAIADYLIKNNSSDILELHRRLDNLLVRLGVLL